MSVSAALKSRVRRPSYLSKIAKAEDLLHHFPNGAYVGWSGFTGVGYPKWVLVCYSSTHISIVCWSCTASLHVLCMIRGRTEARMPRNVRRLEDARALICGSIALAHRSDHSLPEWYLLIYHQWSIKGWPLGRFDIYEKDMVTNMMVLEKYRLHWQTMWKRIISKVKWNITYS